MITYVSEVKLQRKCVFFIVAVYAWEVKISSREDRAVHNKYLNTL